MKTLLLCPAFNEQPSRYPFLGVAYLAGELRRNGYPVEIVDAAKYRNFDEYARELKEKAPDLLGISVLSIHFDMALRAARVAKEVLPGVKVVFGGAHPTTMPEETIANPEVDFVVAGEGEYRLLELVRALESGVQLSETGGILSKNDGEIRGAPDEDCIGDLDALVPPARDLLPMGMYLHQAPTIPLPYPTTSIIASRGCRGNCLYCQPTLRKLFGRKIRYHSARRVVDEMAALQRDYHVKGIFFADDEPTWEREWMLELCDELSRRKLGLVWTVASRVDTVDREMLVAMKKAGCIQIGFGVESGSQKILNYYRKGVKVAQVGKAFQMCNEVGIIARANIMIGAPVETEDTVQESISLIEQIKPDFVSVAPTTPTVGTDLFFDARQKNLLRKESLSGYDRRDISTMTRELTDAQIKQAIRDVMRAYRQGILSMIYNPKKLYQHRHFFHRVFMHWFTMISNPGVLVRDVKYYLTYSDKEKIEP